MAVGETLSFSPADFPKRSQSRPETALMF